MAKKRKFIYFLGAGASNGAGAVAIVEAGGHVAIPTQATFWSTFLRFCGSASRKRAIESFLFRYFLGYRKVPSRLSAKARRNQLAPIDVEEVFTFLSERVRAPSTSPQLRTYSLSIWNALLAEIGHVFRRFDANANTRRTFRAFHHNHVRRFDVIVSFNYDTVFEDSLAQNVAYAYEGIDSTTRAVPILKPHGSINWALDENHFIYVSPDASPSVVVAPTHLKFVSSATARDDTQSGYLDQSPQIQDIWTEMERQMKAARALVFIGYSFPIADLYFSSVLRSVLADRDTNPDVVVVNPDAVAIGNRLRQRFALTRVVRYFDLAQYVQATRADVLAQLGA